MVSLLQGKVKCMNRRSVKIMRRKAGGTAGKNAEKYSVNLPAVWLRAMGIQKDNRVELSFDGEKSPSDRLHQQTRNCSAEMQNRKDIS